MQPNSQIHSLQVRLRNDNSNALDNLMNRIATSAWLQFSAVNCLPFSWCITPQEPQFVLLKSDASRHLANQSISWIKTFIVLCRGTRCSTSCVTVKTRIEQATPAKVNLIFAQQWNREPTNIGLQLTSQLQGCSPRFPESRHARLKKDHNLGCIQVDAGCIIII